MTIEKASVPAAGNVKPWWSDPHDGHENPDNCVGCLMLDPDLTPHENMEEAYKLGFHYGREHTDGLMPCPECEGEVSRG